MRRFFSSVLVVLLICFGFLGQVYWYFDKVEQAQFGAWIDMHHRIVANINNSLESWLRKRVLVDRAPKDQAYRETFDNLLDSYPLVRAGVLQSAIYIFVNGRGEYVSNPKYAPRMIGVPLDRIVEDFGKDGARFGEGFLEQLSSGNKGTNWYTWGGGNDRREYLAWDSFDFDGDRITVGISVSKQQSMAYFGARHDLTANFAVMVLYILLLVWVFGYRYERDLGRAKRAFFSRVSYELRTPLNTIISLSSVIHQKALGMTPEAIGKYSEYSTEIYHASHELMGEIENLLRITEIAQGRLKLEKEEFTPSNRLAEVVDRLGKRASENQLSLQYDGPSFERPFYADPSVFMLVIRNLLSNAIKYNVPKGTVELFAYEEKDDDFVVVRDTGKGLDKALLKRRKVTDSVYEPPPQGIGLGLPLVYELVGLHHGSVTIESVPGEGTKVILRFPKKTSEK